MSNELKKLIEKTKKSFPKSFVNDGNELILEPKNNLYFRLENIQNELDFTCQLIAWLSRPISKGLNEYWSQKILKNFNDFLGTDFTKEEMSKMYTYLGNGVNKTLCIRFVEANYDLSLLK